jgi:Na+-translocating ferredoxin:NAD+ oxidoreductase subunit D
MPLHQLTGGVSIIDVFQSFLSTDAATGATPLTVWKTLGPDGLASNGFDNYYHLLIGAVPGSVGGTCVLAVIAGFVLLVILRIVKWEITFSYLITFVLSVWAFGGLSNNSGLFTGDPFFHLLTGGVVFCACFMVSQATPLNIRGKIIFGIFIGFLTAAIRVWSVLPEGAVYALVIGNLFMPLIDKISRYRMYGLKNYPAGR